MGGKGKGGGWWRTMGVKTSEEPFGANPYLSKPHDSKGGTEEESTRGGPSTGFVVGEYDPKMKIYVRVEINTKHNPKKMGACHWGERLPDGGGRACSEEVGGGNGVTLICTILGGGRE